MPAKRRLANLLAVLALASAAAPALADVPPNIEVELRKMGRVVAPEPTAVFYDALEQKPPYTGVQVTRDIAYAAGPKEVLDVFAPAKRAQAPAPVILFVHGGAFVGGDKAKSPKGELWPYNDNIMLWAVNKGMVGVNMNYPLAPDTGYPKVQQDIGAVITWIQKNIGRYGGDPNRVFIWGHSAGAAHVATYVSHPEFYPGGKSGLRGAILVSGIFDLTPDADKPHVYYGPVASLGERSSLSGLVKTATPLFVTAAELDPEIFVRQAEQLNQAMCGAGHCPAWYGILKDHSHMSETYSVNTPDQSLTGPVLTFIQAH